MKSSTYLRRAERDDLDTIVTWMEDPDFHLFLYGDPTRSQKRIREGIVAILGRAPANTVPSALYLVADAPDLGPVGMVALQKISWRNRSCTLDLYIGRKDWRAGRAAGEIAYRALEYCFYELNLHRVSAFIYAFNAPSWRLLERTGAKRELVLRDHIYRDGAFHDVYGYGLLRREFDAFREEYRFTKRFSIEKMLEDFAEVRDKPAPDTES